MLHIEIENREIYIPQGTKILLEVNNSIFDTEKIQGDIIFTFDVPADKNDIVFQHARYVYVERKKSYAAKIKIGGFAIADGLLIIQNSTLTKYSCGIVMNPYPEGFANQLLKNNKYGDDTIFGIEESNIDTSYYNSLKAATTEMLRQSLNPDSPVKFARFYCPTFYDSKNEAFIDYVNYVRIPETGYAKIYDSPGKRYENAIEDKYALAPQINLLFLLKQVIKAAGYTLIGDINKNSYVSNLFYQSFKSVEGLFSDYKYPTITSDIEFKEFLEGYFYPDTPTYEEEEEYWGWYTFVKIIPFLQFNAFAPCIRLEEHTPNMTNSEFINTICDLLGCTFFINSQSREIEMSFAKDIKNTKAIDLSKYQIKKETKIEPTISKKISYTLGSVLEEDFDKHNIIGEVNSFTFLVNGNPNEDMPEQEQKRYSEISKGKIFFVRNQNSYYQSTQSENNGSNYAPWEWSKFCGNTKILYSSITDFDEEIEIVPKVKIPIAMYQQGRNVQYPTYMTNQKANSRLYNTGTADFDLILNYYRGEYQSTNEIMPGETQISTFSKLHPITQTTSENFNLTVDGDDSLGGIFIKPYINLLQKYEPITMQFLFPLYVFLEVWQLIKPQNIENNHQKRWIMVENTKMLPIQMKFELTEGKQTVKAEIKLAKPIA